MLRLTLDADAEVLSNGRTLVGGAPLRIVTLSERGAAELRKELVRRRRREATHESAATLIRHLLDAGILHPVPVPAPFRTPPVLDVAVIIPARAPRVPLRPLLDALSDAAEIVVVDDGSDPPIDLLGSVGVRVLRNEATVGASASRNRGLAETSTPIVAFVDSDIVPRPGWFAALLAHFDDPTVGMVAPRVRAIEGDGGPIDLYERTESPLDRGRRGSYARLDGRLSYVPSATLLVRRTAAEEVNGFDEGLRLGEDVDLVWRMLDAGWRIRYEPAAEVGHHDRTTVKSFATRRFQYGYSAALLATRHGDAVSPVRASRLSAALWVLLGAGRWRMAAATFAISTVRLGRTLPPLPGNRRRAIRVSARSQFRLGRTLLRVTTRFWSPLTACLLAARPEIRRRWAGAAFCAWLLDWRAGSARLDPVRFIAVRLLDDFAYNGGVLVGCVRTGNWDAVRPRGTLRRRKGPRAGG